MSQPGEGPSRGLLRDCTTSPINRFAALVVRWLAPAPATAPQLENEHNSVSRLETAATGAGDGEAEVSLLFVAL